MQGNRQLLYTSVISRWCPLSINRAEGRNGQFDVEVSAFGVAVASPIRLVWPTDSTHDLGEALLHVGASIG